MRTLLVTLVLLPACGGNKDDLDGDGYTADLDCDEGDAAIHADAVESCDGIDNDCDGTVDDGVADEVYPDADGDGYGDATAAVILSCEARPGEVPNRADCDDTRSDVNPDQEEDCTDVDRNCDGSPTSGGTQLVYYDGDADGYGDPDKSYTMCDAGPQYVAVDGDCDDERPEAYPGSDELCNELDDDCDFTIDEDPIDAQTLFVDSDLDGFGSPGQTVTSCPAPGLADNELDCDDTSDAINPTAPEVCNLGVDDDCDPLTDENDSVLWYEDLDADGFGNDAVTFVGCEPPLDYVAVGGDCYDLDAAINPVAFPGCVITHCGLIALSETWQANLEHRVTCDVEVEGAARPVLTIEDGTVVTFDPDTELVVADGSEGQLVVEGAVAGVVFASSEIAPTYGDWGGLVIGDRDQGSTILGLTVRHAGGNGLGGITLDGSDATLANVVVEQNLNDGLHIVGTGAEPLVYGSRFVDNTDHGVYIGPGAGVSRTPVGGGTGPSFEDNLVEANAGIAITLPGSHADELSTSSTFVGNGQDVIELLTGTLRFTGVWFNHGIPYVVAASQTVSVEDGPQAALTIEPATELFFDTSAELRIGVGAGGTLTIDAVDAPVFMTGTDTVISTGVEWDGVQFGPFDLGSSVQGLFIERGGANTRGNVYVNGSAPLLANIVSSFSDNAGLYVGGTGSAPEIRDCEFTDNDTDGVYVSTDGGLARSQVSPTFAGNVLARNRAPIVVPPNLVGEIDLGTVFIDNDEPIGIHGGDLLEDGIWPLLAADFRVYGDVDIQGPQDPILEIEAGVTLYFDEDAALNVGTSDDGALLVQGTEAQPVTMTSSATVPGEGDWEGIEIGRNGPLRAQSVIEWLVIEYAGGSDTQDGGAIELQDRDGCISKEPYVSLSDVTIRQSSKSGLYTESFATYSADRLDIDGALDGCFHVSRPGICPAPDIVSFTDNQCANSAVFGTWSLYQVGLLSNAGNTFPGDVIIVDSELDNSLTMPALPVAYRMTETLQVADNDGQPVLTVASGATLKFDVGTGLDIGASQDGGLVLEPGALLTASDAPPSPGDWLGVTIGQGCYNSVLSGTIEYGGANGFGAVFLDECGLSDPGDNDMLVIDDLTVARSSTCGLAHLDSASFDIYADGGEVTYVSNLGGGECAL